MSDSGMHGVEYRFHSAGDSAAHWRVRRMHASESISAPYQVQLEVGSTEGDDPSALLGASCTVRMLRDDAERCIQGIVERVSIGESVRDMDVVQLTIVPALSALHQRMNSRIFQNKTIPEILDAVLKPALAPFDRTHRVDLHRGSYPRREYVVQHQESDYEFVRRLAADEGIWFCFEHPIGTGTANAEVLVLVDTNEGALEAAYASGSNTVSIQAAREGNLDREAIGHFTKWTAVVPTSLTVREYDWTNPPIAMNKLHPGDEGDRPVYEAYGLTAWEYSAPKFGKFDTADQGRLRWELSQRRGVGASGSGNVIGMMPGQKLKLAGHPAGLDGEWLVVSVRARGQYVMEEARGRDVTDYGNQFTAIPIEVPYRPRRQRKPRVHGMQTAMVVGPDGKPEVPGSGDDIHTDEHGRVQVKFPWDRSEPGGSEATVSCFLRVAQGWGGSGWGFKFIPRIGMEVLVSFLEGDPDRPMVTGCVYNGLNRPFYELPGDKTRSYIMTQSTPGGGGSNEIRFEDAKGAEEFYVHAQMTHTIEVGQDRNKTVGANQTETVKGNKTIDVSGTHTETVTGDYASTLKANETRDVAANQTQTVGGDQTESVTGNVTRTVSGNETATITGNDSLTVSGSQTVSVSGSQTVTVGMASAETVALAKALTIGAAYQVSVGAAMNETVGGLKAEEVGGLKSVSVGAASSENVGTNKSVAAGGNISESAGKDVALKAGKDVSVQAGKKMSLSAGDDFALKGAKKGVIEIEDQLTIKVGSAQITLKKSGDIVLKGAKITVNGSGDVVIKGSKVSNN
ncbi:MAG: type VI secretion system tip protein TssI/VgrG [Polyangiales bacterium]